MLYNVIKILIQPHKRQGEKMYTINYNTGVTDSGYDDLDSAKAAADKGAAYTQQSIVIEDEDGNEVSRRSWNGVAFSEGDDADPIQFGDFGYYADWQDSNT